MILEKIFKGVQIDMVNRRYSGEVPATTAEQLKVEVALEHPDLVLWQLGTNDALARVPVDDFVETVKDMLQWLKERRSTPFWLAFNSRRELRRMSITQRSGTLCARSPPLKMCSSYIGSKLCNSSSGRRRLISFQVTTCTLTISAIGAWRSTLHARSSSVHFS